MVEAGDNHTHHNPIKTPFKFARNGLKALVLQLKAVFALCSSLENVMGEAEASSLGNLP